ALGAAPSASAAAVAGYIAMARLTADRALAAGLLKPADAESLLDVLGGPPGGGGPPTPGGGGPAGAGPAPLVLARTKAEFAGARAGLDLRNGPVVLVPTMGALHSGHG